jgi:LPXTG-site transpeptidase (sortase) family protein
MKENKPSKLALGIALFVVGLILLSKGQEKSANNMTTTTFANEPIVVEGFTEKDYQSFPNPKRIVIPKLGIDLEVDRANVVDGYWKVYEDKAGWGEGSGFPGQPGNQVIFAHARDGLFLPLQTIKVDDEVYILTDLQWFKYKVAEIKEVEPNKTEVIAPTDAEILTLYTCSGYKDTKRLIVIAQPI